MTTVVKKYAKVPILRQVRQRKLVYSVKLRLSTRYIGREKELVENSIKWKVNIACQVLKRVREEMGE